MRRRDLLKAAGAGLLPVNLRQALAMPVPAGGMDAIEHVVILMQENRSFDHYYGTLRGVRGFSDPAAVRSVFQQAKSGGGTVLPYEVGDEFMEGTPHDWGTSHTAWNSGAQNNWVTSKGVRTMTYLRRRSLPFYYALADAFTLCDAYFCSEMGPTNPNRFYLFTGMIGYEPGSTRRAIDNDSWSDPNHAGYTWKTYAERLEAAGRTWGVYQEWDNYGDNSLEYFVTFLGVARKVLARTGFTKFQYFCDALLQANPAKQEQMLADLATGLGTLTTSERRLYDRALRRVRPGTLAASFKADVMADRLPAVSWIVAPYEESEHPTAGPNSGAHLVSGVLDGLASNPAVWNKTVVFLNYDENDGFFDHIPPPAPPVNADQGQSTVSVADEITLGVPIGLGARVPMMVVSPWSRGGNVCSEIFDHTSVIRFLEKWTGTAEPNISPWRRTVCGDLTSTLDFTAGGGYPSLPAPVPTSGPRPTYPAPPPSQAHPRHEPGIRPSRALPYVLEASGRVAADRFWIDFANTGMAGAHFYVHANAFRTDGPWRYTVGAKASVSDYWAAGGGPYDLIVSGPCGFVRRFVGNRNTSRSAVTLRYAAGENRVYLRMTNNDSATRTFTVSVGNRPGGPWTYSVAPGSSTEDYFTAVDGWYDVTATSPDFLRRFAGRMENGRHRTSDPVMGSGALAATVRSSSGKETQLDLGAVHTVTGLTCEGTGPYELYLGTRENQWHQAATGTLSDAATIRTWPTQARYIKLVANGSSGLSPMGW
ncbi:phosphocholine-specific phospholipase C [Kibdelosporangium phytohabitans]|uniref:Phospholipase n=1 Tax=Kibdelosporangium phytohabitans TaxID=860235 RepID=A0A0N9I4E8_9PSEU|nr:phospholipase C, phosphocholine-specific [Kibdelosporangium phytohabitans]ALG14874.1 phospholipase [Kibdelosporangium phytohabitans]MBE1470268.1 phospholipase C [Kibdelosporangium phytohabitans]